MIELEFGGKSFYVGRGKKRKEAKGLETMLGRLQSQEGSSATSSGNKNNCH